MKKELRPVYVTKSFLPPVDEYKNLIDQIWKNGQLTNQGQLLKRAELYISNYLNVDKIHFVANGTLALQIALRSLEITGGEVITTPFSYVATTSAILWERCEPIFVDIDPQTLNIDPTKVEEAITPRTKAILAVHVFGNPCDIESIDKIARKHNLRVIYDAAHGFGVKYRGKSLLDYGDISICSFHATKVFHTIEGGCLVARDESISDKVELIKRFGHEGDSHRMLGINAKASEFQAAMGILNIKYIDENIKKRGNITRLYDKELEGVVEKPIFSKMVKRNFAYYPVILPNEKITFNVMNKMNEKNIYPRRYFFPSLNKLPYLSEYIPCPISENISERIVCLPLFADLPDESIEKVTNILRKYHV